MLNYHIATTEAPDEATRKDYLRFCDWYARLNAVVGGQMLPFPRLAANKALEKQKRIPVQIRLEIPGDGFEVRAEHRFNWRLSKQDRSRIDDVREQLRDFRMVSNAEYREVARK